MTIKHLPGPYGSFDERLLQKCDELFQSDNLVQSILLAHLLIEQALVKKLEEKLVRPEVLHNRKYSQLSFAQKAALYIGLFNPDSEAEGILLGFNKLRNAIAHQLVDEEDAPNLVRQCFQVISSRTSDMSAMSIVRVTFGYLTHGELGAVHGVRRTDVAFDEEEAT